MNKFIKISRSTVEKYFNCPRCCFLERNHKIKPPSLPFTLNLAVDNLCKNEFDYYRNKGEPHPLFLKYSLDAIPFKHKDIDRWRDNFQGLKYISTKDNYEFHGAVDDIWQKSNGDLIISDVKATSKNKFDWDQTFNNYDYPKGYKRQLEMYQWLLVKNGFKVAKEAYILYFNGKKNEQFFNNSLNFDTHLIKLDCSYDWVENKIIEIVSLIRSNIFPNPSPSCDLCNYLKKRWYLSKK